MVKRVESVSRNEKKDRKGNNDRREIETTHSHF